MDTKAIVSYCIDGLIKAGADKATCSLQDWSIDKVRGAMLQVSIRTFMVKRYVIIAILEL